MKKIKLLGNYVAIEKVAKAVKRAETEFFSTPEVLDSYGVVRYISEEAAMELSLKPGDEVWYGPHREPFRMQGLDLFVMAPSNVYATVLHEEEATK